MKGKKKLRVYLLTFGVLLTSIACAFSGKPAPTPTVIPKAHLTEKNFPKWCLMMKVNYKF